MTDDSRQTSEEAMPCENTDREIFREGDLAAIYATAGGGIGISVDGFVIVKPLREWHKLARPSPTTDQGLVERVEPSAYLKFWTNDAGKYCCRVDLAEICEPWLDAYGPQITPLYTQAALAAMPNHAAPPQAAQGDEAWDAAVEEAVKYYKIRDLVIGSDLAAVKAIVAKAPPQVSEEVERAIEALERIGKRKLGGPFKGGQVVGERREMIEIARSALTALQARKP